MIKEVVLPRQPPQYCKHKTKDGRVCSLYLNHYGRHKEKHGHSYWGDDEGEEI